MDFHQRLGAAIPEPTNVCDMPDIMGISDAFGKGREHLIRHPKIGWTGNPEDYEKQFQVMRDLIKKGGFALKEVQYNEFCIRVCIFILTRKRVRDNMWILSKGRITHAVHRH